MKQKRAITLSKDQLPASKNHKKEDNLVLQKTKAPQLHNTSTSHHGHLHQSQYMNTLHDFNCIVDRNGRIQFATSASIKNLGYMENDFLQKPFWDAAWFASDRTQKTVREALQTALNGETATCHVECKTKEGKPFPMTFTMYSLSGREGSIVSIVTDLSPATTTKIPKGAKADLKVNLDMADSLQHLNSLVSSITNLCIVTTDLEGTICSWSKGAEHLLGFTLQDTGDKLRIIDLLGSEGQRDVAPSLVEQIIQHTIEEGDYHCDLVAKNNLGENLLLEVRGALLKDELEHVLGLLIIMENVTGHRRNEGELRESESLYHLIADNVTDVIWLTDANWNITYMTPSAKAWGYQVEDLQGKSILELINQAIPPETIDSIIKQVGSMSIDTAMHDIVHKKKGQSAIYPLTLMDGSTIWIEAIFNVLTDCNGNITGLMGISRDVTERKQAEEELRHREERFETLTENISDAIAVVGLDGITISVTSSVERIIGYKPEDLVGKNGLELIHPEELPEAIDLLGYLVGNPGAAMSTELRYLHKNGDWIWMEMNARNLLDDPNIQGIVVNYHDITERKQTEELLQQSEEHFRTLIENASDAIAIIDANGIITYESASVEKLLGYRPDELIGRQAFDLVYPDDLWWILSLFQGMSENPGDMRAIETRLLSVDGTWRWFEITSQNLLQNTSIQGFVINYRDITDRKQADDLLRQSNRELQELVHISAHNLREPLRKITAFSGMLVESLSGRLDEDEQENLSFIIDGSRNMQKMVDALHSYSQLMIKEEHLHNVDLNRMIKNLQEIKLLPKLRETNGRIEIPEPLPTVHANNTQMYQLFNHLISNSLKYHKEDSSPRIVVRSKQVDGNMVQVEVEDNGIGIEEEHQEEVFGMFRRLHHPYDEDEGTGMGLTFCQKIVRRHGGEMGVKSSLGEGSIFWFTLPAVTPKEI